MYIPVPASAEYKRIFVETPSEDHSLPAEEDCRLLCGGERARPAQELALRLFEEHGELVVSLGLGTGKTFIYAELMEAELTRGGRPLLIAPGGLRHSLRMSFIANGYTAPNFLSIDELSREDRANVLDEMRPTMVVVDEAHRLTKTNAAAKRVFRFLDKYPGTFFIPGSGTFFRGTGAGDAESSGIERSGLVFAYALRAGYGPPVPKVTHERDLWARALGSDLFVTPGALGRTKAIAREAFQQRLSSWPALLHLPESSGCDAKLYLRRWQPAIPPRVLDVHHRAAEHLSKTWELPDGTPLTHAPRVALAARDLALGVYARPCGESAPREWLVARRDFNRFVREKRNRGVIDTDAQAYSRFPNEYEVEAWLAVRDMFEPQEELVVMDEWLPKAVRQWFNGESGCVWIDRPMIGRWLADELGFEYYNDGRIFVDPFAIVSIDSYGTGSNLQQWNRALLLTSIKNGEDTHQLLGRHHRQGQRAEEVTWDIFTGGPFRESLDEALDQARANCYVSPYNKLLVGDWLDDE